MYKVIRKLSRLLLILITNPVAFIALFGPVIAFQLVNSNSYSISLLDKNYSDPFNYDILIKIFDYNIQAYTVLLAYIIGLLMFIKLFTRDFLFSRKLNIDFIEHITIDYTRLILYFIGSLTIIIGYILILGIGNHTFVNHYINNYDVQLKIFGLHSPPLTSPLTWYRMLLVFFGVIMEFINSKLPKQ